MSKRNEDGSKACICHEHRPVCDCEPVMTISQDQLRFVRLHQRHFVERCQALFGGAMVRATTDRGMTATVRLDELEGLVESGVVAPCHGGLFVVTPEGARL